MKTKTKVSDAGAVIIIDWPQSTGDTSLIDEITSLFKQQQTKSGLPIYLLSEKKEISHIKELLYETLSFHANDTLFIYPGESARYIKDLGFSLDYEEQAISAKRFWIPNNDPVVLVGRTEPDAIDCSVENIIVVDDVISSGTTMSKVYKNNCWKYPKARWYAVTPFSRKERLANYKDVFCSFVIEDVNNKKPPINSLSTLIKSPEMRATYLERNFVDSKKFIDSLNSILGRVSV